MLTRFRGRGRADYSGEPAIGVVRRLTGVGQNKAKELFRLGKVTLGGQDCPVWGTPVGEGVWVEVDTDRKRRSKRVLVTEANILFRDEVFLVVEKPSGIVSVPPTRTGEPTLFDSLLPHLSPSELGLGLAPVHRLDFGTSGLMLFGFKGPYFERMGELISSHQVDRRYLALVEGTPREGLWDTVVDVTRARFGGEREQREARTWVQVLQTAGEVSLVECRPQTGRFHQIRKQLSDAGHPVLGDKEHVPRDYVWRVRSNRLALHSHHLALRHPATGTTLSFDSPLPDELIRLVERIGLQA